MTRVLLAVAVASMAILGCYDDEPEYVSGAGMVVFLSFEGGFYGIVGDDDRHWDPSNLPEQFRVDSLRVYFEAEVTNHLTFHMWGRTVDLISIQHIKRR